jgi:hypothetical protein
MRRAASYTPEARGKVMAAITARVELGVSVADAAVAACEHERTTCPGRSLTTVPKTIPRGDSFAWQSAMRAFPPELT